MRLLEKRFAIRSLAAAVQAALASLAVAPGMAAAQVDEDLAALLRPASSVEIGALYVSDDSNKFGQFTGLDEKGWYLIGNARLYGGAGDASAYRWRILASNLGLDSRSVAAEFGTQGRWRLTAGYDQIVNNRTDGYQTFYRGLGSTSLMLPPGYPAASTRIAATNNANAILANWHNIQSPNAVAGVAGGGPAYVIPANMSVFDVATERKIGSLGASTILGGGWEFRAGARHEEKDGTKLTGVNFGRFAGLSTLLPEPISSSTDQFDVGFAFAGERANFSVGYYGSIYRNDIGLWTVENPGGNNAVLNNVARLQSYPDNQAHQLNLSGGYRFSPATRMQVSGSWSRLTQNDDFIASPTGSTWVVPETSAHAKVINKFLLAKLTSQVSRDVNVLASYRYDDRDNKTPIEDFRTTASDLPGASTIFENEPINRRLQQANLEAEYRLARGRTVRAEYEWQEIERGSSAHESPFRADRTRENTVRGVYRSSLSERLSARFSYAYSERRSSEYEEGNPRPTSPPAPLPAADPLMPGFEQFFLADRDRQKLRSMLNFQASDNVSVQTTLDYNRDRFPSLEYGLREAKSWVLGVDTGVIASDKLSFNAFYTFEDMKRQLDAFAIARGLTTTILEPHVSGPPCAAYTNVPGRLPADYFTDPCRLWSESQKDRVHTVGLAARYGGLMNGRLNLTAELAHSRATTPISVTGGTYFTTGVPSSATGNVWVPAESFPDIKTEFTQLRLSGAYALDKLSSVRVMYMYGRLKSTDWAYDAYAQSVLGVLAVQNYIGPGMTSPDYNVNAVGVSYIHRFR